VPLPEDPLHYSEDRPDRPVSGGSWRSPGDAGTITVPRAPASVTDPAQSLHYFGPNRFGVQFGPRAFRAELHAIDPRLEVTWHPLAERWIIWAKNPDVTFWMHPGWSLLFPVQAHPSGAYLPLDARTLAKVYDRSPRRWGSGRAYFERIVDEVRRDYARGQRDRQQYVRDVAGDVVDHARIQVSMRGHSNGSKFASHHAE